MEPFTTLSVLMIIAAILALIAKKTKQPLIVAYIVAGIICGPWGLSLLVDINLLQEFSHVGIALLLFLAGLELKPQRFFKQVSSLVYITLGVCIANIFLIFVVCLILGYSLQESAWAGVALMFSSTLLFIKLMPKKTENDKKINSFCLSVLIIEDIIAVITLMSISLQKIENWSQWIFLPINGVVAIFFIFAFERFALRFLITQSIEKYEETKILTALGWCLAMALLFKSIGYSLEIGAFLAGISLSQHPQVKEIESGLIFLRDFFLVIFFVTLGAEIDLYLSKTLFLPTLLLSGSIFFIKPYLLSYFFQFGERDKERLVEISHRLGQSSEFGLLISLLAYEHGVISQELSKLIQLTVIFSLIFSSVRIFFSYTRHLNSKERFQE